MALVVAATFTNSFEAGIARSRLEADGVPSFLFDFNTSMEGASFLIPIRLMVDDEDLDDARRILAETLTAQVYEGSNTPDAPGSDGNGR